MTIRFDRLLQLADLLESLPPKRFDYTKWASAVDTLTTPECKTTACALGWATAIPEWGLRLAPSDSEHPCVTTSDVTDEMAANSFAWTTSKNAAMTTFGLSESEVYWLFVPSDEDPYFCEEGDEWSDEGKPLDTASAKTVAQHIRNFVEENREEG